jgi:YbbR domain-containing protein
MKIPPESHWLAKLCTLLLAIALWFVIRQRTDFQTQSTIYAPATNRTN